MEIEINENITKSNPWITIRFSSNIKTQMVNKFEGVNCFSELENFLTQESKIIKDCTSLKFFRRSQDLSILSYFKSLEILSIRGGKTELQFGRINHLTNLKKIHINEQSKPTNLKGIEKCKSIEHLYIGDFTFGKPVKLATTEYLAKNKSLKELFFSNTEIEFNELKKLKSMKNLKHLTLNQKYEFEEFAELSVLLPNVKSNEFKPWQNYLSEKGDIKINGKRKPILDSNKHKSKIEKYEKEFTKLQMKYAI